MEDRRKTKRTQMESRLLIKRMDDEGHEELNIDIVDVSKTGIGFEADKLLKIGEVYEAYLTIWTKEVIHSFLKIVRIELMEENYVYGAVFIGMPPAEADRIAVYQLVNDNNENQK